MCLTRTVHLKPPWPLSKRGIRLKEIEGAMKSAPARVVVLPIFVITPSNTDIDYD